MFKLDLEKAEEPEIRLPKSIASPKKHESSIKPSISALLTMPTPLCGSQQTVENSSRGGKIPDHLTFLLRNLCACQEAIVRTGHGKTDWFQIRKGVHQGCIFSPPYLTYMQSTSLEMPGWMKHRLESSLPGEISIT